MFGCAERAVVRSFSYVSFVLHTRWWLGKEQIGKHKYLFFVCVQQQMLSFRRLVAVASVVVALVLCVPSAHATRYHVHQDASRRLRAVATEEGGPSKGFEDPGVVVTGEFTDTIMETGWYTLKITSNGNFSDVDQAYGAGYLEGVMTALPAQQHYQNHYTNDAVPDNINQWLAQHVTWIQQEVAAKNATDPYWYQVGLMWQQFYGLLDGINSNATLMNFTDIQLLALTAMGDMFDLRAALQKESRYRMDWRSMKKKTFDHWFAQNTHCTSLYKVTDDLQEIFFGHTAWYNFNTMIRVFKHLTLNYNDPMTVSRTISYSSYPGMLSSFDDFYLTDTGINAIETSVEVFNLTMYEGNINPQSVLYWTRVMISTRSATSAPNWASTMAKYNSGTYNNQWMILDLSLFTPGQPLKPNTMWVCEQFPGIVKSRDVTEMLRYGYYPSYNVPMDEELFVWSGYAEAVATQGPEMNDYQTCVRAEIFRRDQGNVKDLASFQHLMRYNNFEQDPISNGNPLYAIAARVDLDPEQPQCFGALDAKISSYSLWRSGQTVVTQSGPTQQQPIFEFNNTLAPNCGLHAGLPEIFRFGWYNQTP
jgi:hypothetical protein